MHKVSTLVLAAVCSIAASQCFAEEAVLVPMPLSVRQTDLAKSIAEAPPGLIETMQELKLPHGVLAWVVIRNAGSGFQTRHAYVYLCGEGMCSLQGFAVARVGRLSARLDQRRASIVLEGANRVWLTLGLPPSWFEKAK
jgi:hypothetical protein